MPVPIAFRAVVVVAVLAFAAGCLAAVANADTPPAPPRTLVASGTGVATVTPKDRHANASIAAAVAAAEAKALPAAIADARAQATALAAAAGVTLGPLVSVSNTADFGSPFGYGPFIGPSGTFGPGKYCGKVTSRPLVVGKDGRRHPGKPRTRRTCRVPRNIERVVQLTFALS